MAMHDELANLFSRNLTLEPYVAPKEEPITYSISQHYHHSAHVAAQPAPPERPSSEPPQTDQLTAEIILSRHGVDVKSLTPSQLELFKSAEAGQQMRLVELWRICPPDGHVMAHNIGHWPATSIENEVALAKLRYERQILEERMSRTGGDMQSVDSDAMSDASIATPMTPIQGGDGRWSSHIQSAEPYMTSGYETLAQREYEQSARSKDVYSHFGTAVGGPTYTPATDPVYKSVEDVHRFPNMGSDWDQLIQQRQAAMENQYGAFEQQYQHNMGGQHGEDEEML